MALQQGVIIASWDEERREFIAKVGEDRVAGLTNIVARLTENDWEIAGVVPLESASAPTSSSTKSKPRYRVASDVLALFVKRHRP